MNREKLEESMKTCKEGMPTSAAYAGDAFVRYQIEPILNKTGSWVIDAGKGKTNGIFVDFKFYGKSSY